MENHCETLLHCRQKRLNQSRCRLGGDDVDAAFCQHSLTNYHYYVCNNNNIIIIIIMIFIRSTSLSGPNKVGLKCPYVRPESFFDLNEVWYVGRGQ